MSLPINEAIYNKNHGVSDEQLETEAYLVNSLFFRPNQLYSIEIEPKHLLYYGDILQSVMDQVNQIGSVDLMTLRRDLAKARGITLEETKPLIMAILSNDVATEARGAAEWLMNRHYVRQIADFSKSLIEKTSDQTVELADMFDMIEGFKRDHSPLSANKSEARVVEDWIKHQRTSEFTPTGLLGLDDRMNGGLYDGYVYGLAGYAKSGKTMLAGTISGNLNKMGVKHLYVAMEMGAGEIAMRQVARSMGVPVRDLRGGNVPIPVEHIHNNVLFADAPGITWNELKMKMISAIYRDRVKGFIIDYWQLIQTNDTRIDKHQFWADVAQGISDFCKRHNVWCILIAQLNDDGKTLGSRGLVRACDMLLNIERCDDESCRWLKMEASRYTEQVSLGTKENGYLAIDNAGPHMRPLFR